MIKFLKIYLGLIFTTIFLYYSIKDLEFKEFYLTIKNLNFINLLACVFFISSAYFFRSVRWLKILNKKFTLKNLFLCTKNLIIGNALNNVFPLRAGDVFRIINYSKDTKSRKSHVTASIVVEKIFDIGSILLAILFSLFLISFNDANIFINLPKELVNLINNVITIMIMVAIILLIFFKYIVRFFNKLEIKSVYLNKFLNIFSDIKSYINYLQSSQVILVASLLSLIAWFFEIYAFYLLSISFNLTLSFSMIIFVASIATLSTIIPSSPGYIGTFHYSIIIALSVFEVSKSVSFTYAFVMHLMLWSVINTLGLSLFISSKLSK